MTGTSDLDGFEFSRGCFYPPTVLEDVGTEDELWREEVFGPVVVVKKFEVRLPITVNPCLLHCLSLVTRVDVMLTLNVLACWAAFAHRRPKQKASP